MSASTPDRIAILGLGLIGSSVARALSEKKLTGHIAAYNHSSHALEFSLKAGFIHSAHTTAQEAVMDADIIILATPPHTFADITKTIASSLKQGAIVTDVGSVKRSAIEAIKTHIPAHAFYVPAHPIAGSEKTGAEAGRSDLFIGKKLILTPEESELRSQQVTTISTLWERIGAKIEFMPAFLHDQIYAHVSHLPQVVAFAVAPFIDQTLSSEKYQRFKRLSGSDAKLWADICVENKDYVVAALSDFISFLFQIHGELKANPKEGGTNAEPMLFAGLIAGCLIASASLLQEQAGINAMRYAGSGFADMTATAVTDPQELLEKISNNSAGILPPLAGTIERLQQILTAVTKADKQKLIELFTVR